MVIFFYGSQDPVERKVLWEDLSDLMSRWDGEVLILGDFNEVRYKEDRKGSVFNSRNANVFNDFIRMSNLVDIQMGGYTFTWSDKQGQKLSKLDRFLVSVGLLEKYPNWKGLVLDRYLSDHRPILLHESKVDYGPVPFRLFNSWLSSDDVSRIVNQVWEKDVAGEVNAMVRLKKNLQALKIELRKWNGEERRKKMA